MPIGLPRRENRIEGWYRDGRKEAQKRTGATSITEPARPLRLC